MREVREGHALNGYSVCWITLSNDWPPVKGCVLDEGYHRTDRDFSHEGNVL